MKDPKIEEDVEEIRRRLKTRGITFEDKRVLITGGAGFLGSWICDVLIKDGAKVWCLDNFASGLKSNISHLLPHKNFRLIEHDVSQPIPLKEKFDFVIHAASRASPLEFSKFPIEIIKANTLGTMNSLELAKRCAARFLFTSSSEVYGNPN
ncbi:MAG: NAD-dependent epimerase/dehydratase family protein, partial [Candidatus Hadarchaeales archaeon]